MRHTTIEAKDGDSLGDILSKAFEQLEKAEAEGKAELNAMFDGADEVKPYLLAACEGVPLPSTVVALTEVLAGALAQIDDSGLRLHLTMDVIHIISDHDLGKK